MLKLIFSPYYDGNCYAGDPDKNHCELGTKYVGPLGLLDELELRSGMSRGETSPMQRAIAYCNAIRKVLNSNPKHTPFYQQSFENDPLGVAQQLLCWRDALCMAGWDKGIKLPDALSVDGKKRLEDLQAIEEHFKSIGIGERWQILLAEAQKRIILPADVSIGVNMKLEYLPPVIRKVLEEIKNKGGNVSESQDVEKVDKQSLSDFVDRFILYQFPEQNDAYQWAAAQTEIVPNVYVNEDNFTFNQVLKSVGKPLVAASIQSSVPEMSQLLKLGIALFRQPVNLTYLTNYLNIFRHPIQWQTRSSLRYKIQNDGGFKSVTDGKGNLISFTDPTINDTVSNPNLWGMWEKTPLSNGNVQTADVTAFCDALLKWLKKAKQVAAIELDNNPNFGVQLSSQLAVLENQAQYLKAYLSGKTDISNDELDKVVASICQGDSIQTDYGRLGSCDMLKDLKGLAVSGKTVMWMDCVRKPRPQYEYAFLNPADIKELQKAGLLIPDATLEMQASDFAEKLAVSRAERIIALMPQRKDGERTEENLIITELMALNTITIGKPGLPNGIDVTTVRADTQKVEHQVDTILFTNIDQPRPELTEEQTTPTTPSKFSPKLVGYQRDYESFSSLNELINQPFDYVLDYIYNMKDEDSGNLSTVEGNVAHWVISQMVEDSKVSGKVDTPTFLNLCSNRPNLEARTDKAIFEVGAQLLQPENEMECSIFKRIFIDRSVPVLVKIITNNHLEVVGSEVEYTSVLKDTATPPTNAFNFNAKIDFLLKRKSEESQEYEYLIFDFKWTGHPNKRQKELEDCKELQLALYQEIAEVNGICPVVMRGYYLLKQAQLLTVNDVFKPNDAIIIVPRKTLPKIFEQAVASYRERIQNLKDGYIEEGEEMKGTEFENTVFVGKYISNPDHYYLNNKLKKNSRGSGMTATTKDTTYGKNAVLKGKIK